MENTALHGGFPVQKKTMAVFKMWIFPDFFPYPIKLTYTCRLQEAMENMAHWESCRDFGNKEYVGL